MKGLRRLLGTSTSTAIWAVPVKVTRASPLAAGDKSPRLRLTYRVWQERNVGAKSQRLKPRDFDCKPKKQSKNGALSVRQKKNENASLKRSGGLKRHGNNEIRSSAV
jgi:hypothetical protein